MKQRIHAAFDSLQACREIKGFLDEEEGEALYRIAGKAAGIGPCLEIGSYCGKSSAYMGLACREKQNILFSVDHHRGSEEQQPGEEYFDPQLFDCRVYQVDTFPVFRQTMARLNLEETVVPLVCRSEVAARKWQIKLGLVFIDGGHALETVQTDYQVWSPHILPKGYLLFHDIFENPDDGGQAPYAVYRQALSTGLFEAEPMIKTIGVLRRK
jgi:hypothetical protein